MGAALWLALALSLFAVARIVPPGRPHDYLREFVIVITAALLSAVFATALDFGGWREPDWRALLFIGLGVAAAVGSQRALRLLSH